MFQDLLLFDAQYFMLPQMINEQLYFTLIIKRKFDGRRQNQLV